MKKHISSALELGGIVETARKQQNLRQFDTAGLIGVGARFLSDLENVKETVQLGKVLKVLDGLGLALVVVNKDDLKADLEGKLQLKMGCRFSGTK